MDCETTMLTLVDIVCVCVFMLLILKELYINVAEGFLLY